MSKPSGIKSLYNNLYLKNYLETGVKLCTRKRQPRRPSKAAVELLYTYRLDQVWFGLPGNFVTILKEQVRQDYLKLKFNSLIPNPKICKQYYFNH